MRRMVSLCSALFDCWCRAQLGGGGVSGGSGGVNGFVSDAT